MTRCARLLLLFPALLLWGCQGGANPRDSAGAPPDAALPSAAGASAPTQSSDPGSRFLPLGAPLGALPAETHPLAPSSAQAPGPPGLATPLRAAPPPPPPPWDG